jgi:general L-amino acid transport system substrate-binding protein
MTAPAGGRFGRNVVWNVVRNSATLTSAMAAVVNPLTGHGDRFEKVNSALELNGAPVCVQQGTTTEFNLADYVRTNKMQLKSVTFLQLREAIML